MIHEDTQNQCRKVSAPGGYLHLVSIALKLFSPVSVNVVKHLLGRNPAERSGDHLMKKVRGFFFSTENDHRIFADFF